jgi:hypothetical protein
MLAIIWNQSALDDLAEIVFYSKLHCRLSGSDPDSYEAIRVYHASQQCPKSSNT